MLGGDTNCGEKESREGRTRGLEEQLIKLLQSGQGSDYLGKSAPGRRNIKAMPLVERLE